MEIWQKRTLPMVITAPFAWIEVAFIETNYVFDLCKDEDKLKIRVSFPSIASFRWSDDCFDAIAEAMPRNFPEIGSGSRGAYPLMEVKNSQWLAAVDETQKTSFGELLHFKLFSVRDTFDVLTQGEPRVELLGG